MIKELEGLPCEWGLKEFGLFSQERRMFRGNLNAVFQFLEASYKENTLSSQGATKKGNRNKLYWEKFDKDASKRIFLW